MGRIGGLIIIGAALLAVPAAALSGSAGASDYPNLRHVNLLMNASLALFGSGVGVLGVFGPRPFGGRGIRIGLGALGVGLLSFVVFLTIPILPGSNDLSYGPTAYSGIIAVVATVVGLLMVGIWLLRATGLARAVGVLFVVGLSLPVLAVPFNGDTYRRISHRPDPAGPWRPRDRRPGNQGRAFCPCRLGLKAGSSERA